MTLMAAMLPLLAFAGDWIEMFSQDGKTNYIYSTIENEYDEHLVWIKTTYDTPESRKAITDEREQDQLVFESRILLAFNSTWSKINIKKSTYYGADGSTISTYNFDDYSDWNYISPDSVAEAWRDAARMIYNKINANSSEE